MAAKAFVCTLWRWMEVWVWMQCVWVRKASVWRYEHGVVWRLGVNATWKVCLWLWMPMGMWVWRNRWGVVGMKAK